MQQHVTPSPLNRAVPTVNGVEVLALTLDTVQVGITVSVDGGQPVLEYTVSQACAVVYVIRECDNGWLGQSTVQLHVQGPIVQLLFNCMQISCIYTSS